LPEDLIDKSSRRYFERRRVAMRTERQSFIPHWQDISTNIQPRRGRFLTAERNRGEKRHGAIINSRGSQAYRVARAGLQAGLMSPTRPWFAVRVPDPDLMKFKPVKVWASDVAARIRMVFSQGNLYNMTPIVLGELALFGTGCMTHVDDFEDLARFYAHTAGSYMITVDSRLDVSTLVREYELTVGQMAQEFRYDRLSYHTQLAYDRGDYDQWRPVVHFIEPNPESEPRPGNRFKKWRSVKYEPDHLGTEGLGEAANDGKYLRWSGFNRFPGYCPRWETTEGDVYATDCPGMTSLGDVKHLQLLEKRKAQALEKLVSPPMTGPPSLRNVMISALPNGFTAYQADPNDKLRPIYQIDPHLQEIQQELERIEMRVNEAWYVHLFRAISNMEGIQPRNQLELLQRNEEALLELGPMLERTHEELHEPLIERTFEQMVEADLVPLPPEEIQGLPLEIRYISPLAIAQRAVATGNVERLLGFVGGVMELSAQAGQPASDKINWDEAVDEFAALTDAPPRLVVPTDEAREAREERNLAAQQQQQQAMAIEASKATGAAVRDLGTVDMSEDSAGSRAIESADAVARASAGR